MLITQQSTSEFVSAVESGSYDRRVVSISPQSRAFLAAHFNLTTVETHQRLVSYFKSIGIDDVLDTSSGGDFALLEARAEFVARFKAQQPRKWAPPPCSAAQSSTVTTYPIGGDADAASEPDPYTCIPMLASACPG